MANYCAFHVEEPFHENSIGSKVKKDYCYYNMLKTWKGQDMSFPFVDAHKYEYDVRNDSDWESVVKPEIHARLAASDNIVLLLTKDTWQSRALREEIEYGVEVLGLPLIVIYPDLGEKKDILNSEKRSVNFVVRHLWDKLPIFKKVKSKVPVLHVPMDRELIAGALQKRSFKKNTKTIPKDYIHGSRG